MNKKRKAPIKKNQKRRKVKRVLRFVIGLFMTICSIFFCSAIFKEIKVASDIKSEIKLEKAELKELKLKEEDLKEQKENLNNIDYVEYVARGKYLFTKEGEQIFKF